MSYIVGNDVIISIDDLPVEICVIPTEDELTIANQTALFLSKQ